MQHVGKYQLIRKLATGGMAEVYLAKAAGPRGFEKTLVLKRILPHLAEEAAFVEMFLSEAMLAARLTHPHIVQIFDFGEADGAYFLAMEYIDGPSLRTLVKRAAAQHLPLPATLCARIIAQACEGLAFAHDFTNLETNQPLGLIHRDISPDNILLSRQGTAKVVDFGIAKAADQGHRTASGIIKGKVAYMPPEQLRAKAMDRRVDVYALGVVLYELLTARKPFESTSEVGLMQAILFEPMVPAEQHRPDLPAPLRAILARALAKEREQRYPDCHAFQSDLEEFILSEGRPVTTQQVAQLIQRATSGMGLPAQRPTPTPTRSAPVAPGPTQSVPEPSVQVPESRTELDASPETSRPGQGWRTQEALPSGSMAAPRDRSRSPMTPAWALEPTRTQPELASRGRPSRWTRRALVGAVLLTTGMGLVWEARGRSVDRPAGTGTASPPVAQVATAAPVPAAPVPAASSISEMSSDEAIGGSEAVTEAPGAGVTPPAVRLSSARERAARSLKSRRPASVAMGQMDVRAHPYAQVSVDGRSVGTTPLDAPVELAVGSHTVKLYSPTLARTEVRHIEVKAGKTIPLTVSFAQTK